MIINSLINNILKSLFYKKLKEELYCANFYNKFKIIYNVIFGSVIGF